MLLKKIVVAEDDDSIAHMVSMALGDAGYLCIRARDGEEAMQAVRMHQPDLLVLDVMMPRLDGRQVAQKLTEDAILSKIPIMMLTALSDVDSKIAGLDAGADDYMGKPFDLREFSARVRALIRSSKREHDRNAVTDLPGSLGIEEHIGMSLESSSASAVVQFDVDAFGEFATEVADSTSVDFVKALSTLIYEAVRGLDGGFLGHLGGTDFIATCPEGKAEAFAQTVIDNFETSSKEWVGDFARPLSLICCIVPTPGVSDAPDMAKRLALSLSKSRKAGGSNYVVYAE